MKEQASSGPSPVCLCVTLGLPATKGNTLVRPEHLFHQGELAKQNAPWLGKKKKMEVSNSYFPFTCLKYDNRVSECPSRDTRMRSWWAENTMPASFPLWGDKKTEWLAGGRICSRKECNDFGKELYFFFFFLIGKKKKKNEKKMLIVAARKYAWENGLYHLLLK